jgi:hypothetical protein
MLSYFSEQLAGNASRGLINRVTDVKLLQGDPAEAWREGDTDYATVAMKFALKDSMVERVSGRTVEGGERSEVTELWTFMRARIGCSRPSSRLDGRKFRLPCRQMAFAAWRLRYVNRLLPVGEYRTALQHRAGGLSAAVAGSNPARGAKLNQ